MDFKSDLFQNPLCSMPSLFPLRPLQKHLSLAACICLLLFLGIMTRVVLFHSNTGLNLSLHIYLHQHFDPFWQKVFLVITYLAAPKLLSILWLIVLAWLSVRRYWFAALHWAGLGIITIAGVSLLKPVVASPRPDDLQHVRAGFSFPSGHTSLAASFYSFLAWMLLQGQSKRIVTLGLLGSLCLVLSIAFSRIYLGAHWPLDVLGGLFFGLGLSLLTLSSYARKDKSGQLYEITRRKECALLIAVSMFLLASFYGFQHWHKNIKHYQPKTIHRQAS